MTTAEILADLGNDCDLAGTVANLEATYFKPLEQDSVLDPMTSYRLGRARDALALAMDAVRRLADCTAYQSNRL